MRIDRLLGASVPFVSALLLGITGCTSAPPPAVEDDKGPHRGRMLRKDGFAVEVKIYEEGVPPEFRLYGFEDGKPVDPTTMTARITLRRLDRTDQIAFTPRSDYLLGDQEIYEPHSFDATVTVSRVGGTSHEWTYPSYEGRTQISATEVEGAHITIERVGPVVMKSVLEFPGAIALNADATAHVVPRLAGVVSEVRKNLGDAVKVGDLLAVLSSGDLATAKQEFIAAVHRLELARSAAEREEALWKKKISPEEDYLVRKQALQEASIVERASSQKLAALGLPGDEIRRLPSGNQSGLARYDLRAPLAGTIIAKDITVGESVQGTEPIYTISDLSTTWAEIAVPADRIHGVRVGQGVIVRSAAMDSEVTGTVAQVGALIDPNTRTAGARVVIPNADGRWRPGLFVTVRLTQDESVVPMAVKAEAIQSFRDWDVVFIRVGDLFEARPLELGRRDGEWIEVLSGLEPGLEYASKNSFVIKADVLKSGASHDH